jgi:GntR family transcriptional regulator, transcriptional repressor for pyruvate dehydrogenase complex
MTMTSQTRFRPVRSARLSEEIIRQIAQLVADGQLKVGEQFPSERTLQQQWQVSRPVLREAFRALEVQGLVDSRPGGGRYLRASWIPDPLRQRQNRLEANRENLLQLWDARESVEVKAAELAARWATPGEIEQIARPLRMVVDRPADEIQGIDFNREFHLVIARASRNPLIEEMIIKLVAKASEIGFKELLDVEDFAKLLLIHQPIADAIAAHDPSRARAAMATHFAELRKSIGA